MHRRRDGDRDVRGARLGVAPNAHDNDSFMNEELPGPGSSITGREKKHGRVALVTGGMGGIGEAITEKFGASRVSSRSDPLSGKYRSRKLAVEEMKGKGLDIYAVPCDVTDEASCAAAVKKVEAEVGPIDILVNNAGITKDGLSGKCRRRIGTR